MFKPKVPIVWHLNILISLGRRTARPDQGQTGGTGRIKTYSYTQIPTPIAKIHAPAPPKISTVIIGEKKALLHNGSTAKIWRRIIYPGQQLRK